MAQFALPFFKDLHISSELSIALNSGFRIGPNDLLLPISSSNGLPAQVPWCGRVFDEGDSEISCFLVIMESFALNMVL